MNDAPVSREAVRRATASFSGTSFAGWYFVVQAFALAGWWLYLYPVPDAVQLFTPPGAAAADLRAFQLPDLLVAGPVSVAASVSIFLFVVPAAIVFVERQLQWPSFAFAAQRVVAALLFMAFSSLGLASGLTMASRGLGTPLPFDATSRLVTSGPYSYVRNPMVGAGLGQGLSVALWFGSWAVVTYVLVGGMIWQHLVRPSEERDLRDTLATSSRHTASRCDAGFRASHRSAGCKR